ncbi:unnamed protein product, partial [Tetraodon nigroviridis]
QTVHTYKPHFLALHCQEVGGKNYEASMSHVDSFVKELLSSDTMKDYNRARVYLDKNYKSQEHFTPQRGQNEGSLTNKLSLGALQRQNPQALGSFYFIHESLKNIHQFDFKAKKFKKLVGKETYSETLESTPTMEKEKFPQDYFPECKWSRKGFIRTRWALPDCAFDLVNIHLFHDASNLVAWEKSPSVYSGTRQKALGFVLDRITDQRYEKVPHFVFGDFNFRLDSKQVIEEARAADLDKTNPHTSNTAMALGSSMGRVSVMDPQGSDTLNQPRRAWWTALAGVQSAQSLCSSATMQMVRTADTNELDKLIFRESDNDRKVVLQLEKKLFSYVNQDVFRENNGTSGKCSVEIGGCPVIVAANKDVRPVHNGNTVSTEDYDAINDRLWAYNHSYNAPIPLAEDDEDGLPENLAEGVPECYAHISEATGSLNGARISEAGRRACPGTSGFSRPPELFHFMLISKDDEDGLPENLAEGVPECYAHISEARGSLNGARISEAGRRACPGTAFAHALATKLLEYDKELSVFKDRLHELEISFPPSYPYSEDSNQGKQYMNTRCPAWCDRILLSTAARDLVLKPESEEKSVVYDNIGPSVCMGDHK